MEEWSQACRKEKNDKGDTGSWHVFRNKAWESREKEPSDFRNNDS